MADDVDEKWYAMENNMRISHMYFFFFLYKKILWRAGLQADRKYQGKLKRSQIILQVCPILLWISFYPPAWTQPLEYSPCISLREMRSIYSETHSTHKGEGGWDRDKERDGVVDEKERKKAYKDTKKRKIIK